MQQRALRSCVLALGTFLALAGLAAAQASVDGSNVPLGAANPPAQTQRDINALYNLIFPIALLIGILVEALILYAIIRFRGKGPKAADSGEHERGHHKLEIAWTIPPAVILLIVGLLSAQTLGAIETGPPRDFTVTVVASQFSWRFDFPDGQSGPALMVEVGKVVDLNVTSVDVIHSFSVPSLGVKIDAIPGRVNHYWLQADQVGDYQIQCMEYCGEKHAFMRTKVVGLAAGSTPQGWLVEAGAKCAPPPPPPVDVHFVETGGSPWNVEPKNINVGVGDVCFAVINDGAADHNMEIIDGQSNKVATMHPRTISGGQAGELPAKFASPGTYTYYCAVPGHRQLGMEGTITVA